VCREKKLKFSKKNFRKGKPFSPTNKEKRPPTKPTPHRAIISIVQKRLGGRFFCGCEKKVLEQKFGK